MDAYDRSTAIEEATMTRVADLYYGALKNALKNKAAFFQKIKDMEDGKLKPPQYYVDTDQVNKWRQGFYRELMRQNAVIDGIMEQLNKAGVEAAQLIRGSMVEIYQANRDEAVEALSEASAASAVNVSFAQYDKGQIAVLLQEKESPFSKLAYNNLGQNTVIRRRLQNELAQATILGESQAKIVKRIMAVTDQTVAQARRVAQTERTRVQSQARWETGQEAAEKGVGIVNEWSARMVNTRDSHAALDGKRVMQGETFRTIWGNDLRYPGDPTAPAREVINCHCVLVPDVLLPGEKLDDNKNLLRKGEKKGAAIAGIRFVNKLDTLYKNVSNVKPMDGYEDVAVHADKYSFVFRDSNGRESTVSAVKFANILKKSPDYHGGNIRLLACEAGMEEAYAAQGLADSLGVEVMAPTGILLVYPDGELSVVHDTLTNAPDWSIFKPRK